MLYYQNTTIQAIASFRCVVCQGTGCRVLGEATAVRLYFCQPWPQQSDCTSSSPEMLAATAVCYSLHLHPQHQNTLGSLKIIVAFYYVPTEGFWFIVGLQIHVSVLCLRLNSTKICLFSWKKTWLSLCWRMQFSQMPSRLNSTWRIMAVCDSVLIRERTSPRTCIWLIFQRNLSTMRVWDGSNVTLGLNSLLYLRYKGLSDAFIFLHFYSTLLW